MSHHTYDSFGFFMHAAPLLCATAFLFFLFGIGLASFVFSDYAEQKIKAEKTQPTLHHSIANPYRRARKQPDKNRGYYAERYHMSNLSLIHKWCYWGYHGFSTLCSKATQVTNISSQPKG